MANQFEATRGSLGPTVGPSLTSPTICYDRRQLAAGSQPFGLAPTPITPQNSWTFYPQPNGLPNKHLPLSRFSSYFAACLISRSPRCLTCREKTLGAFRHSGVEDSACISGKFTYIGLCELTSARFRESNHWEARERFSRARSS